MTNKEEYQAVIDELDGRVMRVNKAHPRTNNRSNRGRDGYNRGGGGCY